MFIMLTSFGMCFTVVCEERRAGREIAGRNCSQSVRICDVQQILLWGMVGAQEEVYFGLET
jgi:hypothetical protein